MITIYSPRIHNLGDFANCLPVLSGLHKKLNQKFKLVICSGLRRFKGIRELLLLQDMFCEVLFVDEVFDTLGNVIWIDDTGGYHNSGVNPLVTTHYYNFIKTNSNIDFEIDSEFELKLADMDIDCFSDKILVGDRWSSNDAPDVDTRRYSNMIQSSGILKNTEVVYLDYTKDLMYNCNLIRLNPNPFVTTFTGIGIISDLMKKRQFIIWGDDLINWNNQTIEHAFKLHYYLNRNSKLMYINDFDERRIHENFNF
jgi:hypothetical protein